MDSRLQNVRDTFLHFLADNLTGITVHPRRRDVNDPSADQLELDALNVEFMGFSLEPTVSTQQVIIDALFTNERDAIQKVDAAWTILRAAFYTPLLDYSAVATPVPVGANLFWDINSIRFKRVYSGEYTHYTCLLSLKFTP